LFARKKFHYKNGKKVVELSETEILAKLYSPHQSIRKEAHKGLSEGLKSDAAHLSYVTNVLLQDKSINDRLRNFDSPESSRHLANEISSKTVETMCQAVESFQQNLDDNMELEDALETLKQAQTEIPVRSHPDWKQAVIEAARQYELLQVATILPVVHQEYSIRVENGINFPQSLIDKKREEYAFQLCETARQQIIEGRTILGEPANLKF
jgi:cysteinyl-tRNA synthetase